MTKRTIPTFLLILSFSFISSNLYAQEKSAEEMEKIYWERIKAAKMNFVKADVDFMSGMIGHHAQALIMSALAEPNGASKEVRVLASRIINAQKDEIKLMQNWLKDRDQPYPEVKIDGLNLTLEMTLSGSEMKHEKMDQKEMDHSNMDHSMHGGMDHSSMPGMLSQAQLVELSEAKGADFDRLFLEYMIQHHTGAITMVNDLIKVDGAAQDDAAFKIASDINVDQMTEIERMRLMLLSVTGLSEDQ